MTERVHRHVLQSRDLLELDAGDQERHFGRNSMYEAWVFR